MEAVIQWYSYKQMSASATVQSGGGKLGGIFVSAASAAPTITVYDNTAGSGAKLVDTFTPVAGTWYTLPFAYAVGLSIVISGTVSCTVAYQPA